MHPAWRMGRMSTITAKPPEQTAVFARYVLYRVKSELKAESARNYFSYLWWVLEPALMIAVFYLVFGVVFRQGAEGFVSFLLLGVTAWLWFANTLTRAMLSIRREMNLMLQVYVPKYVFPLSSVLFGLFKQLFVVSLLLGLLLILESPSLTWAWFGLIFLVQLILVAALSMIVAAIVPFVPDLAYAIPPLLQLGMFLSGVFYPIDWIPESYQALFRLNPMAGLIMEYRNVMLYAQAPDLVYLAVVAAASAALLAFGLLLLGRFDRIYPRLTI